MTIRAGVGVGKHVKSVVVLAFAAALLAGCGGGKKAGKNVIELESVIADYSSDVADAGGKYKGKVWIFRGASEGS